jgi:hypothetical protein
MITFCFGRFVKWVIGCAICLLLIPVIIWSSLQPEFPEFNVTEWNFTVADYTFRKRMELAGLELAPE